MSGNLRDAALHVPMGLAFAGIALATSYVQQPLGAAICGAWMVYLREVSQIQEDINAKRWKFLTGWNPFAWSSGKNIETWVPVTALIIGGWGVTWKVI